MVSVFLVTILIKVNDGSRNEKTTTLTKREQDQMLELFYAELEIEFIGYNKDVDLNRAESDLSEDEENKVAEADDGPDDKPPVVNDTDDTHKGFTTQWPYSSFAK